MTATDPAVRTPATDYDVQLFENKKLMLFDLFRANVARTGDPMVRGVTFRNCQIEGPGVILPLEGCDFNNCNFGRAHGDVRTLILYPASPERVTGPIAFIDCRFETVDFFSIGYTGPKEFIEVLLSLGPRR